MRVLLSFPTRIGTVGIGTTAWYQATGLARRGAEVHLICGSVERALPGVHVRRETMRLAGQKVPYRLVGHDRATAWHDRCVARTILCDPRGFDVVHAWPEDAERTLRAARQRGIPALLERPNAHTAFAFEVVAAECERLGMRLKPSSPHAFNPAKLAREEREFAAADALLCPSDFVASTHLERGAAADRVLRHRYGYDAARFGPPEGLRALDAPLVAAFVGRLEPRKGVHLALEAWREAGLGERARLLLCGAMEPGYERVLRPLLDQPGVEVLGAVADPAEILRRSDALVLPSLEEGSALVTYEARACGAVLLVSDRAGAQVTHAQDGLVHCAGDVRTLAEHLQALDRDPRLRGTLRQASLSGSRELTWDAAAGALLEAYELAAERAGAEAAATAGRCLSACMTSR